jgi:hypothetical protein
MNPLRYHNIGHSKIRLTQVHHNFKRVNGNETTGGSPLCSGVMILVSSFSLCTLVLPPTSLLPTSLNSLPARLEKYSL